MMGRRPALILLALLFCLLSTAAALAGQEFEHRLQVRIDPATQRLEVVDRINLPGEISKPLEFKLHAGLEPSSPDPGVELELVATTGGALSLETYRVNLPANSDSFVLHYAGRIDHPLESYGKEYARGFRRTPGTISAHGVYLSGSTYWYPQFGAENLNFSLQLELPGGWDGVSQGRRLSHQRSEEQTQVEWRDESPQQEIFLLAAEYVEYTKPAGRHQAMVFLRAPDDKLATKYLDVTAQYLEMYEKLIGPYPYSKFVLVENFWETGFGMPSFTLLGPKVIRFPFILHSSYPHEILHNWWGNSVYPDYAKGNWAEGLTAYLADHLIKEQRGQGAQHRQAVLQKYSDYVAAGNDFPLTEFRSRHSSASEAIGYGKALMFFHMLRLQLGDPLFVEGLQQFYRNNRFKVAGFTELRADFEQVSGQDPSDQFTQWVERRGAPQLDLLQTRVEADGDNFMLHGVLAQQQEGAAYKLQVPLALTLAGRDQAEQRMVEMSTKRREFTLSLPDRPLRIDVDPEFDLFRRLDRNEIPAALSQAFGAEQVLLLLPGDCQPQLRDAYRQLADSWRQFGPETVEIKFDTEVEQLPADRAVALLGWNNRFLPQVRNSLADFDIDLDRQGLRVEQTRIARDGHSLVLSGKHPRNPDLALTWVATSVPAAVPGLARKLPHYHKYSYLAFVGDEPANVLKGRWPVINSPLSQLLPTTTDQSEPVAMAKLAPREALASLAPLFSKERMMGSINFLAGEELQGRGLESAKLDQAADYIAAQFKAAGLQPGGDAPGSYFQSWHQPVGEQGALRELKNVIGVIPAENPEMRQQSLVIGAHYDHLGLGWPDVRADNRGKVHYGADDNASGVAVLVELAKVLRQSLKPDRNLVFVAFSGEEAGRLGSKHYVANPGRFPSEECIAMLNLDTVGRLFDKKLLVIGADSAREWVHIFRGAGFVTGVEVSAVSEELDSSDQVSFLEAGVPAVQLFSGPHLDYHRPGDTSDKIDPEGLIKVAAVGKEAVEYLANRREFLSNTLTDARPAEAVAKQTRKVSLGTVPDFSFQGEGYRLSGVVPGSPAEAAGLQEGDIVVNLDGQPITGLRDLSKVLKQKRPGEQIALTYERDGREMTTRVKLVGK